MFSRAVAREIAMVHCRNTFERATSGTYDIRKDPVPFESLRKLLANWPSSVADPEANEMYDVYIFAHTLIRKGSVGRSCRATGSKIL
jgi:hypothetical protein